MDGKKSILEGERVDRPGDSFFTVLAKTVRNAPNNKAIIYTDVAGNCKTISYQQLHDASNRIAKFLKKQADARKNKIIAVSLRPSELLPVILLAVMKSGCAYLPIDVDFPADRIRHILRDSKAAFCITDNEVEPIISSEVLTISVKRILIELENETKDFQVENEESTNIAIVLYTSGSTGTPKGVKLPYSALMNRLEWQWRQLPYGPSETRCICKTALTFVDSVSEIWSPLLQGRTLVVVPKIVTKNPEKFIELLDQYEIQRIVLVPSLLKSMLACLNFQKNKENLKNLNLWVCSGETLIPSVVEDFFNHFDDGRKTIANFYGSTEIMGDVTFYLIKKGDEFLKRNLVPIGRPLDNCVAYIVDEQLNLVPSGEIGELLIAGKNLAEGYLNDSNHHKFTKNPIDTNSSEYSKVFRTGDYAKIQAGQLLYEGRQDTQIKIRGNRVDITEVEKVVQKLDEVREAVVLACDTTSSEKVLLCFIVTSKSDVRVEDVNSKLEKSLISYMIPQVIIVESLPLLTNGKTDRQQLLRLYRSMNESKETDFDFSDVPNSQLRKAQVLYHILASVVGLNDKAKINLQSNFYELGGNSLNSVYMVLKLREKGFFIGITDFIIAKSIGEILSKLSSDKESENQESDKSKEFQMEMLNDSHKNEVIEMITESFITKADLERWLLPNIKHEDYNVLMQELWVPLVEKNLSFIIKSTKDNKMLSVALNFDARDEPEVHIDSKLSIIFDFLESIEAPVREGKLPQGKGQIFHTFMMATSNDLSPAENVIMMRLMEEKCLEVAKKNNFAGILTTNTSPLTQQLGTDVFKYDVMSDYQVNQYVAPDGTKPFGEAENSQRAVVSWKKIEYS
ncbi:hypothetical protein TKK_0011746 [Trichogramma kaykai]|uniref:Carrier domain-containing protein n=1 Tax=Trichogramma kaykai TaxID=54128 RepID=A0ABD2WPN4_9HYME